MVRPVRRGNRQTAYSQLGQHHNSLGHSPWRGGRPRLQHEEVDPCWKCSAVLVLTIPVPLRLVTASNTAHYPAKWIKELETLADG